jgi:hypothetical protein
MIGCSAIDAEKLLQLSYLIYKRFIAGDEDESIEHHAIAMWCGQILLSNRDDYAESDWVHDAVPEETYEDADGSLEVLDAPFRDVANNEEVNEGLGYQGDQSRDDLCNVVQESVFTDDDAELTSAVQRMEHLSFVEQEVGAALARPGAGPRTPSAPSP